jgi:hypothetical protein
LPHKIVVLLLFAYACPLREIFISKAGRPVT